MTTSIAASGPRGIDLSAPPQPSRGRWSWLSESASLRLPCRLGVRYLIVDPTCTDSRERATRPPLAGTPVYLSKRLVVLRLGGA